MKTVMHGIKRRDEAAGLGRPGNALHVGTSVFESEARLTGGPEAPLRLVDQGKCVGKLVVSRGRMDG